LHDNFYSVHLFAGFQDGLYITIKLAPVCIALKIHLKDMLNIHLFLPEILAHHPTSRFVPLCFSKRKIHFAPFLSQLPEGTQLYAPRCKLIDTEVNIKEEIRKFHKGHELDFVLVGIFQISSHVIIHGSFYPSQQPLSDQTFAPLDRYCIFFLTNEKIRDHHFTSLFHRIIYFLLLIRSQKCL
jgi:hypothetical protein